MIELISLIFIIAYIIGSIWLVSWFKEHDREPGDWRVSDYIPHPKFKRGDKAVVIDTDSSIWFGHAFEIEALVMSIRGECYEVKTDSYESDIHKNDLKKINNREYKFLKEIYA